MTDLLHLGTSKSSRIVFRTWKAHYKCNKVVRFLPTNSSNMTALNNNNAPLRNSHLQKTTCHEREPTRQSLVLILELLTNLKDLQPGGLPKNFLAIYPILQIRSQVLTRLLLLPPPASANPTTLRIVFRLLLLLNGELFLSLSDVKVIPSRVSCRPTSAIRSVLLIGMRARLMGTP